MSNNLPTKYGRHSLRFKLVTASIVVQVIMLSLLVWNSTRLANEHLIQQAESQIKEIQPLLNAGIAGPLLQEDLATLGEVLDRVVNEHGIRYIAIFDSENKLFIKRGLRSNVSNAGSVTNTTLQQHMRSDTPEAPHRLRTPITLAGSLIGHLEFETETLSITQAITSIRQQGTTIAIIEIVLSIFLLTFLAVSITRNLLKLTDAVSSLSPSAGTLDLDINSKDEVGGLSLAFTGMVQKLQQREQERDTAARATQESDARYKRLVENLSSEYFFYSHDTNGVFFYASESISDVLGYTQNDFITHHSTYLSENPINNNLIYKGEGEKDHAKLKRPPFLISIYHKDGSERMLEVSESPVIDEYGKIIAMEGIAHDITTRLKEADELREHRDNLEALVAQRTNELQTINDELESFGYSVSHDLRAPLRGINGFSNALLEDYSQVLDKTGKDYLKRITAGTQRMSGLIDDMLNLSRITRYKMNIQLVDLTKISEEIVHTLREDEPDRHVNVSIDENMQVKGDKNLLAIALSNLIGNAWKYTGKTDNANISISSAKTNNRKTFSISDNGAGFNPDYTDKIFIPFQRLHNIDDYPGNGVGLSTVYRVIARHQGKIWAESTLNKGATFHFTLEVS